MNEFLKCHRPSGNSFAALLAAMLAMTLAGCVTTATIPGARADLLMFLKIGQTTREDAMLQLGHPSAVFEQEKI